MIDLQRMGVGSRTLRDRHDYESHLSAGHMWMRLLTGEHISSDAAVIDGNVHGIRHAKGLPLPDGLFNYWIIEAKRRPALESYLSTWSDAHLPRYTGMVNLESISGRIIEVHLRDTDRWPDLCGTHWLDAVVELYSKSSWRVDSAPRRSGYSIAAFGLRGHAYSHPDEHALRELRAQPGISSLQITFHPDRPASSYSMPPGGFRLVVINAWSLVAGRRVRDRLRNLFGLADPRAESAPIAMGPCSGA